MGPKPGASYAFHSCLQEKEGTGVFHTFPLNPIAYSIPPLITYLLITNFIREIEKEGWKGSSLSWWINVVSNLRVGSVRPCQRPHLPSQRHC